MNRGVECMKKKYVDNAERQRAYRERLRSEELKKKRREQEDYVSNSLGGFYMDKYKGQIQSSEYECGVYIKLWLNDGTVLKFTEEDFERDKQIDDS